MTGLLVSLALISSVSGNVAQFPNNVSVTPSETADVAPTKVVLPVGPDSVVVYLPRHISPGDEISGSVFAVPRQGDWDTEHRVYEALDRYLLTVGDKQILVSQIIFGFRVPSSTTSLNVELTDRPGGAPLVARTVDLTAETTAGELSGPAFVQGGSPVCVRGNFNGDRYRTEAMIGGHEVGILAEGRHEVYVTTPADYRGPLHLQVDNKDGKVEKRVNVIGFHFLAPGEDLRSGKRAAIAVEVDGLQDSDPGAFPLSVELRSDNPEVMSFEGPDRDRCLLEIYPYDVVDGHVMKGIKVKARKGGSYKLTGAVYAVAK